MSRTYEVLVQAAVKLEVDTRDELTWRLRLTSGLPLSEQARILGRVLQSRGADVEPDGTYTMEIAGLPLEIDPEALTARARVGEKTVIEESFDGIAYGKDEEDARRQVLAELNRKAAEQGRELEARAAAMKSLHNRAEVARLLDDVTAEAEHDALIEATALRGRVVHVHREVLADGTRTIQIEAEV